MNGYLVAAGAVAAFTTLVHLIAGRSNPLLPMLRADFDVVAKQTMHVAWHLVSVNLVLSAVALIAAGLAPAHVGPGRLLADLMALQFIGYTFVCVVVAMKTRVGFAALPQPLLFVPIIILAGLGR